jgi:hypothetical protein
MSVKDYFRKWLIQCNKLLKAIDNMFLAKPGVAIPPPLFIIGAPRSGTTLVYQVITQHFHVGYMTTPLAYASGMINILCRVLRPWLGRPATLFTSNYGKTPGFFSPSEHTHFWYNWFPVSGELSHYINPKVVDAEASLDLQRNINSLATILGRPWVFKNLYISMSVGILARMLPDARFLFIRRDKLLVFQSLLRGRKQQGKDDWWSVKPPSYREWLKLPLWQQVARQVFYADAIPERDLNIYAPGRFIELDYSDLCRNPHAFLDRLQIWLEPLGYLVYPNSKIPFEFTASDKVNMKTEEVERILEEFEHLEQEFNAQST